MTASKEAPAVLPKSQGYAIASFVFCVALLQFVALTYLTLDQPILDMWGFRPAQTAAGVPYILRGQGWLATIVPVFGEPWALPLEFPIYQWFVAALAWITHIQIGPCGRIVSAAFTVAAVWPISIIADALAPGEKWRSTLHVSALWLFAPVVVFWGRSFLVETTTVFLGLCWLAFYIRFLREGGWMNYSACIAFGVLAAAVKVTAFSGFIVAGFFYSCLFFWTKRNSLESQTSQRGISGNGTIGGVKLCGTPQSVFAIFLKRLVAFGM
jgi:hypothetical protein